MRALTILTSVLVLAVFSTGGFAQQPTPPMVIVQAAGTAPAAAAPAPSSSDSALAAAIKSLEQTKAANDALLKKQEATLQQLDELQKAAEQLKVFSKRV
jgi:hypothetical protein